VWRKGEGEGDISGLQIPTLRGLAQVERCFKKRRRERKDWFNGSNPKRRSERGTKGGEFSPLRKTDGSSHKYGPSVDTASAVEKNLRKGAAGGSVEAAKGTDSDTCHSRKWESQAKGREKQGKNKRVSKRRNRVAGTIKPTGPRHC